MQDATDTSSRWSSQSPLGFEGGDTNLQRYVGNSPTNYTDPTGLWREGGHFYTTYNIGRLAGMNHNDARELAYYSQYPDEVNAYDAVYVAELHTPGSWERAADEVATDPERINRQSWEESVQRILHQLHGGDVFEISRNRVHLGKLLSKALTENDVKFAGVLIHALGDSFAHTRRDRKGRCTAFDSEIGHAAAYGPQSGEWQGGTAVDKIRERYIDGVYPNYVRTMAELFGISENDPRVDDLLQRMRPSIGVDSVIRSGDGRNYTDGVEDDLLRTFPVSNKMINGMPDTYLANEMLSPRASRYFPENGLHGGLGTIPYDEMVLFIEQMRQ